MSRVPAKRQPKTPISIIDACEDPDVFGPWFKDPTTFIAWFAFLRAMFGISLDDAALAIFKECTGRTVPAAGGYREISLVIGRRGGKSLLMALVATYLACFRDWSPFLTGGERGFIMIVAADRRQAAVALRYVRGFLDIALLSGLIVRETQDVIELANGINIEVATASFRTIRGRTVVAALCDELAFWSDENSANPDVEIINALRPAMATVPGSVLIKASSPYARRGALWNDYRKHFGSDDSATMVWRAPTRTMNPSIPQSFIDAAYEDDHAAASAEYGAEFRSDIESFVSRDAVERCVDAGRIELPPMASARYVAFCDPSGGSSDSMTLAIAHREKDKAILDLIREIRPPFSPENVVKEFCELLKMYRIGTVIGDRYAGEWPRERFQAHGVTYQPSAKPKSDIYTSMLPAVNGGRVELLDHARLIQQLCALERRTARSGRVSSTIRPANMMTLLMRPPVR